MKINVTLPRLVTPIWMCMKRSHDRPPWHPRHRRDNDLHIIRWRGPRYGLKYSSRVVLENPERVFSAQRGIRLGVRCVPGFLYRGFDNWVVRDGGKNRSCLSGVKTEQMGVTI